MAFTKEAAIIAQNSATATATIMAALVTSDSNIEDVLADFETLRTGIFNGSILLAGAESALELLNATPVARSGGSGFKPKAYSGGNQGGGSSDVGSIDFRSGKYRGKTIAEVYGEDEDYLVWCSENLKNDFLKSRITEYLASVG